MGLKLKITPSGADPVIVVTGITYDSSIMQAGRFTYSWDGTYLAWPGIGDGPVIWRYENKAPIFSDNYTAYANTYDVEFYNDLLYSSNYGASLTSMWIDTDGSMYEWASYTTNTDWGLSTQANSHLCVWRYTGKTLNTFTADTSGNLTKQYESSARTWGILSNTCSNNGNFVFAAAQYGQNVHLESFKIESDGSINFVNDVSVELSTYKSTDIAATSTKLYATVDETGIYAYNINQSTGALTFDSSTASSTPFEGVTIDPNEKWLVTSRTDGGSRTVYLLDINDFSVLTYKSDGQYVLGGPFQFIAVDQFVAYNVVNGQAAHWNFTIDQEPSGGTVAGSILLIEPSQGSVLLIAPPTAPVPGAPTLYRPLDTSTLGTVDPSLAWLSVSGADTYWVQLDDDPAFGSLLYDVSALAVLYYDVSALDTSTAYYWRAAATNTSGTGSWSSEWEFYTPQAAPPSFPTTGLEAYWNMDEVSGTVTDQTSNSNDLPTNSGVTYGATGIINDCVSINSSGYLQGTSDTIGTAVFSISAWFKTPTVGAGTAAYIFDISNAPSDTAGYYMFVSPGGNITLRVLESGGADGITTSSNGFDDDNWHHLVVTHSGGTFPSAVNFYIDASLSGTTGSGSRTPTSNVGATYKVGGWKEFAQWSINGKLDEMGIWSTVLSAEDVSILFNNGNGFAYPGP